VIVLWQKRNNPKEEPQSYEVLSSIERKTEDGEVDFESRQPSSSALLEEQFIITVRFFSLSEFTTRRFEGEKEKGKCTDQVCHRLVT